MPSAVQTELDFTSSENRESGVSAWRAARERQINDLAKSLNLPLHKEVEIWLTGGIRLRGPLRLREEALLHARSTQENTIFEIGGTPFRFQDIESCIRLDD